MRTTPNEMPWAQTRRLALREFCVDDMDDLVQMHRDRRVRAHLLDDVPLDNPRFARQFVLYMMQMYRQQEGLGIWHVSVVGPKPRFIGYCNLVPMLDRPDELEVGGRAVAGAWGQGMSDECGRLLLDHAFDRMGRQQVWGMCRPDNGSARLGLAALGFEHLGVRSYGGQPADQWLLDAETWLRWRSMPRAQALRHGVRAVR